MLGGSCLLSEAEFFFLVPLVGFMILPLVDSVCAFDGLLGLHLTILIRCLSVFRLAD